QRRRVDRIEAEPRDDLALQPVLRGEERRLAPARVAREADLREEGLARERSGREPRADGVRDVALDVGGLREGAGIVADDRGDPPAREPLAVRRVGGGGLLEARREADQRVGAGGGRE